MIDERTKRSLSDYPILEDERIYLYVIHNELGKIKIGVTKNIQQRMQSLQGSNGQGIQIDRVTVSPSTYLYTLERIMHDKFAKYRIPNTEWFYDKAGQLTYEDVVGELHKLFSSTDYKVCNQLRKEYFERNK